MPRQEQQPLIGRQIHTKEEIIISTPMSARRSVCRKFRQKDYKWALRRRLRTCSFLTSHGICLHMCGIRHLSGLFMNRTAVVSAAVHVYVHSGGIVELTVDS